MNKDDLTPLCIYAIKNIPSLENSLRQGHGTFSEQTPWKRAAQLLKKASCDECRLPIMLGSAEYTDGIRYWAILTKIDIKEGVTHYSFNNISRLKVIRAKSVLILDSSARSLNENFIRSYAICRTPADLLTWEVDA